MSAPAKYRFGTFELDRGTAELRKRGIRIKLQEQPYRILCLLLDSPEKVITRDTLCAVLWPEDTFVEFERSLNAAVAKLRQALGDSAENPRYIETVARRGYRFIAPVEAIAFSEPAVIETQRSAVAEHDRAVVDHPPVSQPSAQKRDNKGWLAGRDAPRVASWNGDELLFSARVGDSVNLWKIRIAGSDSRVAGAPQRLTSGTGLDVYPSLTADGRLVFASLTNSLDVWALPVDSNGWKVAGQAQRVTETIGPHQYASLSADGKLLAYSSVRYGHPRVWIKDLESGKESPLTSAGASERGPQLSFDGSLVAYRSGDQKANGFVVPVRGGVADQFCTDCAALYDLSPDNNVVLYRKDRVIRAFDLPSRRGSLFLRSDHYGVFQSKVSPDGHWVTFIASRYGRSRLFIAALRDAVTAAAEDEWIPLTADEGWADKPRWSPDGNLIYFVSNRDGFFCLWAQRLARDTKRLTGEPVSIAHFHGSRLSIGNVGFSVLGLSVARDKIAFNLGEISGNIWVTNLPH